MLHVRHLLTPILAAAMLLSATGCEMLSLESYYVKRIQVMGTIRFRFDQDHEMFAESQILWVLHFPMIATGHLDDEWLKRRRGQQFG